MHRRQLLALVAVACLILLAGCTGLFGGIPDEELDREQNYSELRDRNASVAVSITGTGFLSGGEYRAVYDLKDTETLSLYENSFYREESIDVHSVRYWYPNGTVVTGSNLTVEQSRSSTDIGVPDGNGTLAFSGEAGVRGFSLPIFMDADHEITLPAGVRTTNFLFGDVSPGGYERTMVNDRERLTWESVDRPISVRYFLPRDVWIFAGFILIVAALGGVGIAAIYVRLRRLRQRRQELGLDIDIDDDRDDPPPGLG